MQNTQDMFDQMKSPHVTPSSVVRAVWTVLVGKDLRRIVDKISPLDGFGSKLVLDIVNDDQGLFYQLDGNYDTRFLSTEDIHDALLRVASEIFDAMESKKPIMQARTVVNSPGATEVVYRDGKLEDYMVTSLVGKIQIRPLWHM